MIYPDVLKKVKGVENSLVKERVEHLYVFRNDGTQLIHSVGTEVKGALLAWENAVLLDSIVTHNHPGKYGTSFSKKDVVLAFRGNVLQMRAVGVDRVWHPGKFYRYVLDRPEIGWPDASEASDFLDYVWEDTREYLNKKVRYYQMMPDRATCILNHLCAKRFSQRFGVAYRRLNGELL